MKPIEIIFWTLLAIFFAAILIYSIVSMYQLKTYKKRRLKDQETNEFLIKFQELEKGKKIAYHEWQSYLSMYESLLHVLAKETLMYESLLHVLAKEILIKRASDFESDLSKIKRDAYKCKEWALDSEDKYKMLAKAHHQLCLDNLQQVEYYFGKTAAKECMKEDRYV